MKKLITVLLALGAMLSTSCKDDVDFEGGVYLAHDVFLLDGDELILLHEHTIDIDSKQRDVDLQIVSEGAVKIEKLDQSPEITLTILTGFTGNDAVIYDYIPIKVDGETRNIPRYVQTLRIIAETNGQKQARDCRFRIITQNPMPECDDITIRQAGAK